MRSAKFLSRFGRMTAAATLLTWGATATPAESRRHLTFEGARPSLEACQAASADVRNATDRLGALDAACRSYIESAESKVTDAKSASDGTTWPAQLRRQHRTVDRSLASASAQLAAGGAVATTNPTAVARHVYAAGRALAKALLVLDAIAPPLAAAMSDASVVAAPEIAPPSDVPWTNLVPSADTRVVYVSTSDGDDANDGLSPTSDGQGHGPKKSLSDNQGNGPHNGALGVARSGYADWVLLKRGDVWNGDQIKDKEPWDPVDVNWGGIYGRSAAEPFVISTYGNPGSPRPKVLDGSFRLVSNNFIEGLDLEYVGVTSGATDAMHQNGGSNDHDITVENCYIGGYPMNISVQPLPFTVTNFTLRGCTVVDAHGSYRGSQGILIGGTSGILIEWCVFDLNGWLPGSMVSTQYNHNLYIHESNIGGAVFRHNISARASSHGCQMRSGGTCENNLFLQNPIALNFGGSQSSHVGGSIKNNVVLDGADIQSQENESPPTLQPRGWGLCPGNVDGLEMSGNITAHNVHGTDAIGTEVQYDARNLNIHDNIMFDWQTIGDYCWRFDNAPSGPITFTNNTVRCATGGVFRAEFAIVGSYLSMSGNKYYTANGFQGTSSQTFLVNGSFLSTSGWAAMSGETSATFADAAAGYPDPQRDIASYMTSIGRTATLSAFMTEARKQERSYWRTAFTADAVGNYVRQGFGK